MNQINFGGLFTMKKGILLGATFGLALLLTGCGNQQKTASTTSASSSTTSAAVQSSHTVKKGPWNATKAQKLASFMETWGNTMNQNYQQYTAEKPVNFNNVTYPDAFSQRKLTVDNTTVTAKYSSTGAKAADYTVVALYSDFADTSKQTDNHLYLFAFHDNEPVVLITESTSSAARFKVTANQTLANGFTNIAAGKAASTGTSANSSASSSTGSQASSSSAATASSDSTQATSSSAASAKVINSEGDAELQLVRFFVQYDHKSQAAAEQLVSVKAPGTDSQKDGYTEWFFGNGDGYTVRSDGKVKGVATAGEWVSVN
jgi:hypothetical protein